MRQGVARRTIALLACLAGLAACQSKTGGQARPAPAPLMLEFRKVLTATPLEGAPTSAAPSSASPAEIAQAKAARQRLDVDDKAAVKAALDAIDCTAPDPLHAHDDPALPLVACDPRLPAKYLLDKAFLTGDDVASAQAEIDRNGVGWVITLSFRSDGARKWADFTTQNVGQQVAIVLDAEVRSAPTIQEAIVGGSTVISGGANGFTKDEAETLARQLGSR